MRNTYKYTKLYSGAKPQFVEGDVFRTIIPLNEAAATTVGPVLTSQVSTQVSTQVNIQPVRQIKLEADKLEALLQFCSTARSRKEMQIFCEIKTSEYFRKNIVKPMLEHNLIKQTIPDKPNSRNQKYIRSDC